MNGLAQAAQARSVRKAEHLLRGDFTISVDKSAWDHINQLGYVYGLLLPTEDPGEIWRVLWELCEFQGEP
jgi:hypothetical protein